jgi:hypothetical protein
MTGNRIIDAVLILIIIVIAVIVLFKLIDILDDESAEGAYLDPYITEIWA